MEMLPAPTRKDFIDNDTPYNTKDSEMWYYMEKLKKETNVNIRQYYIKRIEIVMSLPAEKGFIKSFNPFPSNK